MKENSTSVYQLEQALKKNTLTPFNSNLAVGKSFRSPSALEFEYINPPLSIRYKTKEDTEGFEGVDVVLISATGATGKSALSQYLGMQLKQPIYDMGEAGPVGENSLIGMLTKNKAMTETIKYMDNLRDGHSLMIIDALDEGALKVTSQALNSFYDEISDLSAKTKGIPFVLTGRTHVMETTALELEIRGLNVMLLQIEPFTLDKAKQFIDKAIEKKSGIDRYNSSYTKVRDLILTSVEGFFQDINEMKHKQYERFIGYAPVLQTIAALLDENCNYQQLYEEISGANIKNVNLIIEIIERILKREKGKVNKELLPLLTKNVAPETIELANSNAYNITEQCVRCLSMMMYSIPTLTITGDDSFDVLYEERICSWVKEHPFLNDDHKSFVNVVFESYVVSYLLQIPEYKQIAIKYLQSTNYKTSFMFFDFYWSLSKNQKTDMQVIPYLYDSLISMDSIEDCVHMEILEEKEHCLEITFTRKNVEYVLTADNATHEYLCLPRYCSDVVVDAQIGVRIPPYSRIDMRAPITLICKEILFEADELCLYASNATPTTSIVWDTESLRVNLRNCTNPEIRNYSSPTKVNFSIRTQDKPSYPFIQFYAPHTLETTSITSYNPYYQKLRRTLLMFRSHSKGVLARYKEKIDNRIGMTAQGAEVLEALKAKEIMIESGVMYSLNNVKLASELGIKYDDVQAAVINPQITKFICTIEENEINQIKKK